MICLMKNYVSLRKAEAKRLAEYSKKSISELNRLSPLCFYGTNASVLRHTYTNFEVQARTMRNSCHTIRSAINVFNQQLDGLYPRNRFRITRKYRLANDIENQFIKARKSLKKALDKLPKSASNNEDKSLKISAHAAEVEEQRSEATTVFNTEMIRILKEWQQAEVERLEIFKKALFDFIKAIHPSHYVNPLVQQFQELESHITHEINSTQDVNDWANILGIKIPILSETNQNNDPTTVGNQAN